MDAEITPQMVLLGYREGVFPMADQDGAILWFSPDPRCILEFDRFHVSRSLRQALRRGEFEIRLNTAFERVITACADRAEGTWISRRIMTWCRALHAWGFAHSVETWRAGRLVGGLYGLSIGGAFFGESMFHRERDASKVALVALMRHLRGRGFALVDTQWPTPHLLKLGAVLIPRAEYMKRLAAAVRRPCSFGDAPPTAVADFLD
ncbi:MAG: leucyl/phenylalanyl-tRNA--protein transferase [Planctomycetes bacterium]|nr:leucyl/phenylalanyl-tRNA--protein transferase [Planctomycetota bacterium]